MRETEKIRSLVAYRAYYPMFYAVLALLAMRRAETSRHSSAISLFDREFVKPGTLPKEFSRWLHAPFSERQDADCGTDFGKTIEDRSESLRRARDFVGGVRELLRREGYFPGK